MKTTKYYNVRYANLLQDSNKWIRDNPTLEKGEIAFVKLQNNYIMVVGDGSKTGLGDIVQSIIDESDIHSNQIFFPKSRSNENSFRLEPATTNKLGGVAVPKSSGLKVDSSGYLRSDIFTYNTDKKLYTADKLYIENLSFGSGSTEIALTTNNIELRKDNTEPMQAGERSGLIIHNGIDNQGKEKTSFLGIESNNFLSMNDLHGNAISCVPVKYTKEKGYMEITPNTNYASIKQMKTLSFKDNSDSTKPTTVQYSPTNKNIEIDITPPNIFVNSTLMPYNKDKRSYEIELDGGLTPEDRNTIDILPSYFERIKALENTTITIPNNQDNLITTTIENKTITVTHNTHTTTVDNNPDTYPVKPEDANSKPSLSFISGLELDAAGHVMKIIKTSVTFYIPNIN